MAFPLQMLAYLLGFSPEMRERSIVAHVRDLILAGLPGEVV